MKTQDKPNNLPMASVSGKRLETAFDGGRLTSDGGVLLLREVEARCGVIKRIDKAIADRRHPGYVDHSVDTLLKQRVFQIACGYEDANDCDVLRGDPGFKAACDRLPQGENDLSSQPTMSRFENRIGRSDLYRIAVAFADAFIASYHRPPKAIILDIDDTEDPVHGAQQMALFNGYFKSWCYQPLHIYEGRSGRLITTILRPGVRPNGKQIVAILKRLLAHLRRVWPKTAIILRGDSHFSCPEVHDFCLAHGLSFILGLTANERLKALAKSTMEQAGSLYEDRGRPVRRFTSFSYQAASWNAPQRVVCKAEEREQGQNVRFVVTNLESSRPSFIYEKVYCARGRMEGFIKNHKTFLQSGRTSCRAFAANQFRLFLHSAAYVLLHTLARIGLRGTKYGRANFDTLRIRLLKIAGRVCEMKTKIVFHLPESWPLARLYGRTLCHLGRAGP